MYNIAHFEHLYKALCSIMADLNSTVLEQYSDKLETYREIRVAYSISKNLFPFHWATLKCGSSIALLFVAMVLSFIKMLTYFQTVHMLQQCFQSPC